MKYLAILFALSITVPAMAQEEAPTTVSLTVNLFEDDTDAPCVGKVFIINPLDADDQVELEVPATGVVFYDLPVGSEYVIKAERDGYLKSIEYVDTRDRVAAKDVGLNMYLLPLPK